MSSRHYHIIAGTSGGVAYSESKFEQYEDSIEKLTTLSVGLFGHLFEGEDSLSVEKFLEATEHGDGKPVMVGTTRLCVCWWPCVSCEPLVSN